MKKKGQAKPKEEMLQESDIQLFDNMRKSDQILDCGGQDPIEYINKLFKQGGAQAIYDKLKERQRTRQQNPRCKELRRRLKLRDK